MPLLTTQESYVQPVMGATEDALHPWVATWRFRVILLVISAIFAALAIILVQFLNGNYAGQDPTFEPGGANVNPPATAQPTNLP